VGRFFVLVCKETTCGALIGTLLGFIQGTRTSEYVGPMLIGGGIGAVVGLFVALSSKRQDAVDFAPNPLMPDPGQVAQCHNHGS
jgi:hypothetical protein